MPYAASSTRKPLRCLDVLNFRSVLPSPPHAMKRLFQAVPAANVLHSLTQGLNSDSGMYSHNTSLSPEHCTMQCDPLHSASYALALFISVDLFKFNSLSLDISPSSCLSGLPAISFTSSIGLRLSELPPPTHSSYIFSRPVVVYAALRLTRRVFPQSTPYAGFPSVSHQIIFSAGLVFEPSGT